MSPFKSKQGGEEWEDEEAVRGASSLGGRGGGGEFGAERVTSANFLTL